MNCIKIHYLQYMKKYKNVSSIIPLPPPKKKFVSIKHRDGRDMKQIPLKRNTQDFSYIKVLEKLYSTKGAPSLISVRAFLKKPD